MPNTTLSFHQLSEAQKREIRLREGIGHEDYEREQSLRSETAAEAVAEAIKIVNEHSQSKDINPIETGGTIIFAVQEAKDNDQSQTQIQIQIAGQASPSQTTEVSDTVTSMASAPIVEIKTPTLKDGVNAATETVNKSLDFVGKQSVDIFSAWIDLIRDGIAFKPAEKKDPQKEAEKQKKFQITQDHHQRVEISIDRVKTQNLMMEKALRMRILEDVGAIDISEAEAHKHLKISTSFRGPLTPSNIVNLREAIKYQTEAKKKQESGKGLAGTGSKAKHGQMDVKASTNNEHTGSNAQSAVG